MGRAAVLYRMRIESWRDASTLHLMTVCDGPSECRVRCLARDLPPAGWRHAEATMARTSFDAHRDVIVAALPLGPATRADVVEHLGPPPFLADGLLTGLVGYLATAALGIPVRAAFHRAPHPDDAWLDSLGGTSPRLRFLSDAFGEGHPGYAPPRREVHEIHPRPARIDIGYAPASPIHAFVPDVDAEDPRCAIQAMPAIAAAVEAARSALSATVLTAATACVDARHWTPVSDAYFSASGDAGERRRQAATLHPALAPSMGHDAATTLAIDGGKPFEEPLRRYLSTWLAPGTPSPTRAHMRRIRTLPRGLTFDRLCRLLFVAAHLPADRVPDTTERWRALDRALKLADPVAAMGLDTATVLAPLSRTWMATDGHDGLESLVASLGQAVDMADWCGQFLVTPLLGADAPDRDDALAVGAALLFRGLGPNAILAASRRWHADLPRFVARLPITSNAVSWPALFAPFAAGGVVARCLVTPSELMREGAELSHCVGGYARGCYQGEFHVISLASEAGERLSTLQVTVANGRLSTVQHSGCLNRKPPPASLSMEKALAAAVADGSMPLEPAALSLRDPGPFLEATLIREPGAVGRAAEAWEPHLHPEVPRDLDDLTRLCRDIAAAVAESHRARSMP